MLTLNPKNNIVFPTIFPIFPFWIFQNLSILIVICLEWLVSGILSVILSYFFFCREKYAIYQDVVNTRLEEVGSTNSLKYALSLKVIPFFPSIFPQATINVQHNNSTNNTTIQYSLDAMNEALLARSCTNQGFFDRPPFLRFPLNFLFFACSR